MQRALVNGQLIPAAPDAPTTAACPNCGSTVALRVRKDTFFWRHVQLPRDGCPPPNPERRARRVSDFIIEGYPGTPGGPSLRLRSLGAEGAGEPTDLVIPLREVRPLAMALLDAAAELAVAVRPQ